VTKAFREISGQQQNFVYSNSMYFLIDLIRCKTCNGTIIKVSEQGGYYGCYNAMHAACSNQLLVQKRCIEKLIINDLREKFLTAELIPGHRRYKKNKKSIETHFYYVARTNIQTLALLGEENKITNRLICWTGIRTN
jgi:hypothetical protein